MDDDTQAMIKSVHAIAIHSSDYMLALNSLTAQKIDNPFSLLYQPQDYY